MTKKKFYLTTSIAYTNAEPHLGHALELIQADVLARYYRQQKYDVFFSTGTDEHGTKIYRQAINLMQKSKVKMQNDNAKCKMTQRFVDGKAQKFQELTKALNISNDDFIRTTDRKRHWPAVEKIWRQLIINDDIEKRYYQGLYCAGCEAFIQEKDLINGHCPYHQQLPEIIKEENYFFKLEKYLPTIIQAIRSNKLKIFPLGRQAEILMLAQETRDISFSRPASQLPWGIPVPDDPSQTIYVWSDALINYLSVIGYADNPRKFRCWWPADIQLIGKDILRFHALIWPGMLLAAGLPLPKQIFVHGFIGLAGQKMSKSLGNVITPFDLIRKYGPEPIRYFLLREIPSDGDGNFSEERLQERYRGDLANDLGNLLLRLVTLVKNHLPARLIIPADHHQIDISREIKDFRLHQALEKIWQEIIQLNQSIETTQLWNLLIKQPATGREKLTEFIGRLLTIATTLQPFLPTTSQQIIMAIQQRQAKSLFPNQLIK